MQGSMRYPKGKEQVHQYNKRLPNYIKCPISTMSLPICLIISTSFMDSLIIYETMIITVIRLVLVGRNTGFIVMCKILMIFMIFECVHVNSIFLGCDSLQLILMLHYVLLVLPILRMFHQVIHILTDTMRL